MDVPREDERTAAPCRGAIRDGRSLLDADVAPDRGPPGRESAAGELRLVLRDPAGGRRPATPPGALEGVGLDDHKGPAGVNLAGFVVELPS